MDQINFIEDNYDDNNEFSECESCVIDSSDEEQDCVDNLNRLDDKHVVYDMIVQFFLSNFRSLGKTVKIVAIHKKNWSILPQDKAMLQDFMMLYHASPKENVKHGWLGGSKQEISNIMAHGFGRRLNNVCFHSLIQSVQNCVSDDEGLRHVVLCRVILRDGAKLGEGDGNKFVTHGNKTRAHILPEYIVSFEAPSCLEEISSKREESMKKPSSPWMSFPNLISALAKSLPPRHISSIQKHYKQFIQERVITRRDFIKKMRELVGDELLVAVIKSNQMKRLSKK